MFIQNKNSINAANMYHNLLSLIINTDIFNNK